MRSISALGVRSWRRSIGRYALTAIGASLGVSVFFGVLATNASINRMVQRSVGSGAAAGVSVEPIGSYGNTLPADLLDRAAALPGVANGYAGVWVSATVGDEPLDLRGVRSVAGPAQGRAVPDGPDETFRFEGRMPAPGADEVSLSRDTAARLGVDLDEAITMTTRSGSSALKVVRIVDYPDNNGLTSFETAMRLAGHPGRVQNLYLTLARDTSPQAWIEAHRAELGSDVRLSAGRGDELRNTVDVIQGAFGGIGLLAAFVGGFLIYLTMSTAVAERTRTWGVLRAVGAHRRDVVRAVLTEALMLGVVATGAGLVFGYLLGTVLLQLVLQLYNLPPGGLEVRPSTLIVTVVVGLVTPLVGAYPPARRAARSEPVEAMRDVVADTSRTGRTWIAGAAMIAIAVAASRADISGLVMRLAPLLFLLGAVLVVPVLLGPLAMVVGTVSAKLMPGLGDAAVKHLVRERTRSSYTLGLVMVVLALVLAIGGVQGSLLGALDDAAAIRYRADVAVWGWNGMADDVVGSLRAMDGVASSTTYRTGRVAIGDGAGARDAELVIIEPDTFFTMQGFPWADGDDASAQAALRAGGALVVPEVYARSAGLDRGDVVTVQTTEGAQSMTIAGVFRTPEIGSRVVVGLTDGERWFGAGPPTGIELKAMPGVSATDLRSRAAAVVGDRPGYRVDTIADEQAFAAERIRQNFRPFLAVVLLAGIVGALGMANTLGTGVIRRTREIGVLRAVGIGRRDLQRMVLVEATTLAIVALVLSLPMGFLLSDATLRASSRSLGFLVPVRAPWGMVPVLLVIVALVAAAAVVGPARRIARLDPVQALRFD